MGPDLSHVPNARFSRLLIVANHISTYEALIRTFEDTRFDIDFDVCASYADAAGKLSASRYQLIISGVCLAELDDFLLLKRTQALQPMVPVVVTAHTSETEAARRALLNGAFGVITSPLHHEQTVKTIRLALWEGKLRSLTARKAHALEQCRRHMASYPEDRGTEESFNRLLVAFEKTISSIRTIARIEASTVRFSPFATSLARPPAPRADDQSSGQRLQSPQTIDSVKRALQAFECWDAPGTGTRSQC